jgi:hypothetical protein
VQAQGARAGGPKSNPMHWLCVVAVFFRPSYAGFFVGGNVLVSRITSGGTLSSTAAAVVLDELTPGGSVVQSVSVTTSGGSACTLPGVSTGTAISGKLALSALGNLASLACYAAASGTSNVVSSSVNRAIQLIDPDGTLGTFTSLVMYTSPAREVYSAFVNSAATDFYLAGVGGSTRALSYGAGSGVVVSTVDTSKVGLQMATPHFLR